MNENKLHYTHENTEHRENDDNILKSSKFLNQSNWPLMLTQCVNMTEHSKQGS